MQTNLKTAKAQGFNVEQVIEKLTYWEQGKFPYEEIEIVNNNPEIFDPIFLEFMDKSIEDRFSEIKQEYGSLQFVAFSQFAKRQLTELFPRITNFLKLIDFDNSEIIFGDFIGEEVPSVLAACFNGDLNLLQELLDSESTYDFARLTASSSVALLYWLEKLPFETAINFHEDFLRKCINVGKYDECESLVDLMMNTLFDLSPERCEALINELNWQSNNPRLFSLEECKKFALKSQDWPRKFALEKYNKICAEGFLAMKDWPAFTEAEDEDDDYDSWLFGRRDSETVVNIFKVGRNDPCHCGSGKKYKKCCLQ